MSTILFCTPKEQTIGGDTFDLSVFVRSDTERLTGLDFQFAPTPAATLIGRDLADSAFPDPISADLTGDLGASIQNVADALPPGEYQIATFRFRVEGFASGGGDRTLTLTPRAFPNTTGYVTQAPTFTEHPFDAFEGAKVNTPEPTLPLLFFLSLLRRRSKPRRPAASELTRHKTRDSSSVQRYAPRG